MLQSGRAKPCLKDTKTSMNPALLRQEIAKLKRFITRRRNRALAMQEKRPTDYWKSEIIKWESAEEAVKEWEQL
jgi:hypothetical protein